MVKRGEQFGADYKFKVVLQLLREDSSLAEIASKYNLTRLEYDKLNSNCSDTCIKVKLEAFHENCKDDFAAKTVGGEVLKDSIIII